MNSTYFSDVLDNMKKLGNEVIFESETQNVINCVLCKKYKVSGHYIKIHRSTGIDIGHICMDCMILRRL